MSDFFDGGETNYPLQAKLKCLIGRLDNLYKGPFHGSG